MRNFTYCDPTSVSEAVDLLQQHAGKAKLLAGGTDLFLRMRHRVVMPEVVVDLKRIPELSRLDYNASEGLLLGSAVTHATVTRHAAVQEHYGALAAAANWVGSAQTRNRGTVVGNVCNASPAADTVPPLIAYRAMVQMAGPAGRREVPIEEFFQGPGQTVLGTGEMVTALRLPPQQSRHGWGFLRRTRTVIDIALVSSCVVIHAADGLCDEVTIALGAVGPIPLRARQAEAVLRGQRPSVSLIGAAAAQAAAATQPISDVRCSAAYRKDMAEVLTRRCVQSALTMLQLQPTT